MNNEHVQGGALPPPRKSYRLLWHSILGIGLGIGGGWMVLWFLMENQPPPSVSRATPKQAAPKRTAPQAPPAREKPLSALTLSELYQRSITEARRGEFGNALRHLHKNRPGFGLWLHLYWELANSSMNARMPRQAAKLYSNLAAQASPLWSKRYVWFRAAQATYIAGNQQKALGLLQKGMRIRQPRRHTKGWAWWQQERHVMAEGLWLQSQIARRNSTKARALRRLWLDYPDSQYAPAAEQKWYKKWRRKTRRIRRKDRFQMVARYLDSYGNLSRVHWLLRSLRRGLRSRRDKRQYHRLWAAYYEARGNWKQAIRSLGKLQRLQSRRYKGQTYFRMAQLSMRLRRTRTWRRVMRSLRRRSRTLYAKALLHKGLRHAAKGRSRSATRTWRGAWRAGRRWSRMHIYWYRALLALQSKRGGRRAARELRQAKRTARRLTRRQKQALPPGFFAYWEARANEAKGNKARATKAYLRILNKAPVSFYGLLAGQRLQRLGKLPPLPFAKDNHPALSWTPPTGTPTTKTLALVKQSGPAPLYLLELETRLLRNRNNLGLRIQVAAAAGHQPPLSDGLVWLHDVRKRFLHGTVPISRALLLAAFPKPDKRWPKWIKRARQHKLDSRLVAALLLHVRGFHPDTRRKTYTGPGNASLWLGPALSSPTTTFDEACRRLQQALQTYSSPGLAIDAVLTRRNTYLRHIKQTIPTSSADLHYPFLSQQTRDILQTYWIYKQLYLR